jgi:hypothetical protein
MSSKNWRKHREVDPIYMAKWEMFSQNVQLVDPKDKMMLTGSNVNLFLQLKREREKKED